MIFGPVSDSSTPPWKSLAFCALIFAAGLVVYIRRSKPEGQFSTAVPLAVIVCLIILLIVASR
jgi:hypothetical protein